jgi:hypothetical protein
VWLRVSVLNSLVFSLTITVRAIRDSLRDADQSFSASRRIMGSVSARATSRSNVSSTEIDFVGRSWITSLSSIPRARSYRPNLALLPLAIMVIIALLYSSNRMSTIDARYSGLLDKDVKALQNLTLAQAHNNKFGLFAEVLIGLIGQEATVPRDRLPQSAVETPTLFAGSPASPQTYLYGIPDSGKTLPGHLFNGNFVGPRWLTGGSVGPEGSVLVTLLLVLFGLGVSAWLRETRYPPQRMPTS